MGFGCLGKVRGLAVGSFAMLIALGLHDLARYESNSLAYLMNLLMGLNGVHAIIIEFTGEPSRRKKVSERVRDLRRMTQPAGFLHSLAVRLTYNLLQYTFTNRFMK